MSASTKITGLAVGLAASEVIQTGETPLSLFAERISRFQGPFTGLLPPMSYHCSLALDSNQASRPPTGTITILFRLNFFFLSQKRFLTSSGRFLQLQSTLWVM